MTGGPVLGDLTWLPAADQPHLLSPATWQAIRTDEISCYVALINPTLADTAAFCTTYAVPLELSANCVVVAGRRGEITTMAACVVLATDRADINEVVRRHLDVRKISFAPMDDAVDQTGMEYGGITPIGLPADWPVLVDTAVTEQEWVVAGSGIRGSKIAISGAAVAQLPAVQVLDLRQPPAG